jgi:hypothetical protein
MEHERDLRFLGESRMTTGKHHPQQVVSNCVRCKEFFNCWSESPFTLDEPAQLGLKSASCPLTPKDIYGTILGGRMSQADGFSGTTNFPHFKRTAEGVLHDVFCQREIVRSKDARQRGDHPPRFMPE